MGEAITNPDYEAFARRFQRFAETECRGVSPLYEHLALAIAADEEILALAAHATKEQPVPNLFLVAVPYLLPAFALVAALANKRPLTLIEIGTSAGLNLMWDHYGYRYDPD